MIGRRDGNAVSRLVVVVGTATLVVLSATSPLARAQPRARADAEPARPVDPEGAAASEPRTTREAYDHRVPPDRTLDDAARWPLRILLAPLRLVVSLGRESGRLALGDIGDDPSSIDADEPATSPALRAMPIVHLETERSPAVGVDVSLLPVAGVRIDLRAQHWDDARIEGMLLARSTIHDGAEIRLDVDGSTRSDRIWHGLGWDSAPSARRRYRHHRGGASLGIELGGASSDVRARIAGRVTHHRFEGSGFGGAGEPSVDLQPDRAPPGLAEGSTVLEPLAAVGFDSRHEDRGSASPGAAIGLVLAYGVDVSGRSRWVRTETLAAATIALAPEHDLTLSTWAAAVEPIRDDAPAPFVERIVLGGEPGRLAGFPLGRLHGDSAAIAHLRYRWGIHPGVDAALHAELGNVFGRVLEGLDAERMRLSFGLSIEGHGDPDAHRVGLLFAMGTEPIASGADVGSGHVRFFVGAPPR
jgi:hypothetical protein